MNTKCFCCKKDAHFSIVLSIQGVRIYIPNQDVRSYGPPPQDVWFCEACMRKIEDNLRATIQYLKSENE